MASRSIKRTITIVLIVCLVLCGLAAGFYSGLSYVLTQNENFDNIEAQYELAQQNGTVVVGKDTPGAVSLILPRGADAQKIAEILQDNKVIDNTFAFVLMSKFNGFDGTYVAGTHYVTRTMNYDEIMYALSQGPETVKVVIPPGFTYKEVKAELVKQGVYFDEAVLDSMVNNPQLFLDYDFVTDIAMKPERQWLLQGYLFPDTYVFDINTDEETIIRTFLDNTQAKLTDKLYARAVHQGISMDDAIILASIIEIEAGKAEEMRTISGVFAKRLKRSVKTDVWFPLGSCATINYLRKEAGEAAVLYPEDNSTTFNSLYNTYNNEGLTPGPICSPGADAIAAALWPEDNAFWYFCAKGNGTNYFSRTESEHLAKSLYYKNHPAAAGQ